MAGYAIPNAVNYEASKDADLLTLSPTNMYEHLFYHSHSQWTLQAYITTLAATMMETLSLFSLPIYAAYEQSAYETDQFKSMMKFYDISEHDYIVPFSFGRFKVLLQEGTTTANVTSTIKVFVNTLTQHIGSFDKVHSEIDNARPLLSRYDAFNTVESLTKFITAFFHPDDVKDFLDVVLLHLVHRDGKLIPIYDNNGEQVSLAWRRHSLLSHHTTRFHSKELVKHPILVRSRLSYLDFFAQCLNLEMTAICADIAHRMRTIIRLYSSMGASIEEIKNTKTIVEFTNPFNWT